MTIKKRSGEKMTFFGAICPSTPIMIRLPRMHDETTRRGEFD